MGPAGVRGGVGGAKLESRDGEGTSARSAPTPARYPESRGRPRRRPDLGALLESQSDEPAGYFGTMVRIGSMGLKNGPFDWIRILDHFLLSLTKCFFSFYMCAQEVYGQNRVGDQGQGRNFCFHRFCSSRSSFYCRRLLFC